MIVNLITQTICTFLGGKAVVWFFGLIRGIPYHEASVLSGKSEMLTGQTLADYTNSYRILLYITAAVTMLAFVLALFICHVIIVLLQMTRSLAEQRRWLCIKSF